MRLKASRRATTGCSISSGKSLRGASGYLRKSRFLVIGWRKAQTETQSAVAMGDESPRDGGSGGTGRAVPNDLTTRMPGTFGVTARCSGASQAIHAARLRLSASGRVSFRSTRCRTAR